MNTFIKTVFMVMFLMLTSYKYTEERVTLSEKSEIFDSKFINQSVPDMMIPGQKYTLILTFQNSGTGAWLTDDVKLVIFSNEDITTPVWGISEFVPAIKTDAGNTATFKIDVTAPVNEGVYLFKSQLSGSRGLFGDVSKPIEISVNRNVNLNDALNSSAFVEQTIPKQMTAGNSYTVMISFTNTGKTSWDKDSYRLVMLDAAGNPLTGNFWNTYSVNLDETIKPGGSKVFNFEIIPFAPGSYTLQWRMASGEIGLFGDITNPAVITVSPVPEIKNEGKSGKQ